MALIPYVPDSIDGFGNAPVSMRYEDVAQDGRVLVESLATSVNECLWRVALRGHALETHAFVRGTLAILSRFVVEGHDGPFHVDGPFEAESRFVIAHGTDANGDVARIYLNAWVDTYAPIGRTNFPAPVNAGTRALVGRAFAEHVFTRPFEKADARKVTRLGLPGHPEVPPHHYAPRPIDALLSPPPGATVIDDALVLDAVPIAFGLRHTDSNQHVNSLVYPQLFEDAALRRFAALGLGTERLARSLEIGYRKPCFAGQSVRIALATYRIGETLGACGGFYASEDLDAHGLRAKPHAFIRVTFSV